MREVPKPDRGSVQRRQQRKTKAVFRRIIIGAVLGTESERDISDGHKRLTENTFLDTYRRSISIFFNYNWNKSSIVTSD